ncbi:hypothetical protein LCGC14_0941150 [marine sediment metagenome]|uniref:Uncharacterized protein n=1 Tax=marine sediment metagenome TaxID=412755 RepID=A0A0F9NK15_9ZZZZ|nr:hypothetical protein [Candidatus Aminicenantes bacterium]
MEQALLILLGALLAMGGGFINLYYQSHLDQRRRDIELFHQAEEILLEMRRYIDEIMTPPSKELYELSKRLLYIAMRIKTRAYLALAEGLIEFASMDTKKEMSELFNLIQKIPAISKSPLAMHHRKRNEMVKKAWEEIRRIGGG